MVSRAQINEVVKQIVEKYQPEKIILFGSYADGVPSKDSDVDLLVIKKSDLPRFKRAREINILFNPYPFAMDILVYSPEEVEKWQDHKNSFVHKVLKSGKVLYG